MPRKHKGITAPLRKLIDKAFDEIQMLEDLNNHSPGATLDEAVTFFADVRAAHERIKSLSSKLDAVSDMLSMDVLPAIFQSTHTESPYNHVRGKFSISTRVHAKVLDKPTAFLWLRQNGLGDLIQETVPWQTLGATAAERERAENPLPEHLFEVKHTVFTRFTAPGKKE